MKTNRKPGTNMRKYYQLILVIVCFLSIVTLLIYRREYYRLRYVLEVLNFFGKPGLSEVEFCGPGFNATMLSEILRNSSMEVRETPPLFQEIDENFYSYSSFLMSYQKYEKLTPSHAHVINTIVIGKASLTPSFRCNIWLENNQKPRPGRFSYKKVSEAGDYNLYIFECAMTKNLGTPKGISFYVNNYNINPIHAPIHKVIQVSTKKKIREASNIKFVHNIELAMCVIPNNVPIVSRDAFIEFLVFHHMMGVNHFTIYDSMISEDVIKRLNLFPSDITQWNIRFFPLNYPFIFAKSYPIVRQAIEMDCMYRNFKYDKEESNKVSHVTAISWDEFLTPRVHNNVKGVLDDIDPTRSFRTYAVESLQFCLNQPDDDNAEVGYPDIMKKTHYYQMSPDKTYTYIRNLETMSKFDDIYDLNTSTKNIPLDLLGAHKYTICRDPKTFDPRGYNETEMQVFAHKFEGAMLKYRQNLMSNKIYRLYRSGQIWEKTTNDNIRDML